MRPVCTADNSAVLVVPNVSVRMEAQHSVSSPGLHDLLRGVSILLNVLPSKVSSLLLRRQHV